MDYVLYNNAVIIFIMVIVTMVPLELSANEI